MVACLEHITGKLKFGVDVVPLRLKLAVLVIDVMVVLNLGEGVPAVLICNSFVKGVKCRTRTYEWVIELWQHGLGRL
jgi:hypothetical protein